MWAVAKIKTGQIKIFKEDLIKRIGKDIKFYCPKVKYEKYSGNKIKNIEKLILENYIFCYHINFKKNNFFSKMKYSKGLIYFLNGNTENQSELVKFINHCKSFENEKGYLSQSFFENIITKKAKFVSGPLTNMIFEIIEKQKNKLKFLVGGIITTVPNKSNYLYRPI